MPEIYIGLGSNVGDRRLYLRAALRLIEAKIPILAVSPLYETQPVGYEHQGWFLNAVAEAATNLQPRPCLECLTQVEDQLGRQRKILNGPRTIDLDLLLYGEEVIREDGLVVPHPRLVERRFVLQPLCDLAGTMRHPVENRTLHELLAQAPDTHEVKPSELELDFP